MNYHLKEDPELVRLLTEKDENAFCELYIRYKNRLNLFCIKYLKDEKLSEDIAHDIFVHLWESRQFINAEYSFSSYLFTIAKNRIINYFKHLEIEIISKQNILKIRDEQYAEHADIKLLEEEYEQLLEKSITSLPPVRQKVFRLSRREYKTHREIAEELGISVNTVQQHISESLKFIKKYISNQTGIELSLFILYFLGY